MQAGKPGYRSTPVCLYLSRPMESDDETLMLRYRDGDASAFETLYARHKGPVYRYLLRNCAQVEVAEELFQETWAGIVKARKRYKPTARFRTFLFTMAHHRLVDHYRRRRPEHEPHDPERAADERQAPDRQLDRWEQAQALHQAIAGLPAEQREAFLLKEEAGLGLEEIAAVTGVGSETAKSRLRYAFSKLKRLLGGES